MELIRWSFVRVMEACSLGEEFSVSDEGVRLALSRRSIIWREPFPLLMPWRSTIGSKFCPDIYVFARRLFRGSGQGGEEPAVRLATGVNRMKIMVCKLHTLSAQACVSKS